MNVKNLTISALLATIAFASPGFATEKKITISVVGFTADGKQMLVDMNDSNYGRGLRLYDVETGRPAKKSRLIEYERSAKVPTFKRYKRRYKIKDPGMESMKSADKKMAFFAVEKGERLVIAVTDYQRLGKVTDVELRQDKETEKRAEGRLKTIMWTTDRKTMVLVISQKMKGQFTSEIDTLHYVQFKKDRISWVQADPDLAGAEQRKKGWWPF
ncbi:MAG TPA: hypothetical protein DCQ06_04940 [Myxococcales bacterium]|nr:hypothetical protein [Myxococcales bacterium]